MNDFSDVSQWLPVTSGLVKLNLSNDADALLMDFDFDGAGGFVVARRLLPLHLPERYRFHLKVRGIGPANRFELKLVDPSGDNVWWYKRAGVVWNEDWQVWTIESRDIEYAWGPAGGGQPTAVAALELAIVAEEGGHSKVWLEAFELEDLSQREQRVLTASSVCEGYSAQLTPQGNGWRGTGEHEWLQIDLLEKQVYSALTIAWEPGREAVDFVVQRSDDGVFWQTIYNAHDAGATRSNIYLGENASRLIRVELLQSKHKTGFGIVAVDVVPIERARTQADFLHDVARRERRGYFPKYWSRQQTYWTLIGAPDCPAQALINEEGAIEVHRAGFSLEPFIVCDGRLSTWADAVHSLSLDECCLPLPQVIRKSQNFILGITACAIRVDSHWGMLVRYRLSNQGNTSKAFRFAVAIRPYQLTPPWQSYREFGGVRPIHNAVWKDNVAWIDDNMPVIPLSLPDGVFAKTWLETPLPEILQNNESCRSAVTDHDGLAEAACYWNVTLAAAESAEWCVVVPFAVPDEKAVSALLIDVNSKKPAVLFEQAKAEWRQALGKMKLSVPSADQAFADTFKTCAAHILMNRDGPAIQPGPRRYARSWMRDGATMGAALLRTGFPGAVRDFLRWYAPFQRVDGNVPCCVDREGTDWLAEHDSHGQWIHAVMEYYRFTGDLDFIKEMQGSVIKAGEYLMALRATRCTPEFDANDKVARRGLIPESVSHEGYLAQPVHSFWDSFWALRGLKDAVDMFQLLENNAWTRIFSNEEKALRASIRESLQCVLSQRNIPHIPGSVEWADFDPTATACAVGQLDEKDCFPALALDYTFDEFMRGWRKRVDGQRALTKYSAYDIRIINALVKMGRREEAYEIATFFLADRRPQSWNQWPEISWPDPASPGHLGDLPHSWIGAEFVLAVRSMFVEESNKTLVIGKGIPSRWLDDGGVGIAHWPTWYGELDFQVSRDGNGDIHLVLQGDVAPAEGILVELPLSEKIVDVEGANENLMALNEKTFVLRQSPASVIIRLNKKKSTSDE